MKFTHKHRYTSWKYLSFYLIHFSSIKYISLYINLLSSSTHWPLSIIIYFLLLIPSLLSSLSMGYLLHKLHILKGPHLLSIERTRHKHLWVFFFLVSDSRDQAVHNYSFSYVVDYGYRYFDQRDSWAKQSNPRRVS
ncbi:hypothetical protein BDF14DRAFT_259151 [Spinellus fusiger]|nr:hypothetical protein BDF14DRAFT_259151 [Spinellus fusiger]